MKTEITWIDAIVIWEKYLKTPYLKFHTLESAAIMQRLAPEFNANAEYWSITGLLHDLDMDVIAGNYELHGHKTIELIRAEGYELPDMFAAILAHTEGVPGAPAKRTETFHYVLSAAENITGLITAYVLMKPEKKIAGTEISSIKKRLKQKAFAAGVNRDFIYDIELKAGMNLDVFLKKSIDAMTEIADKTGM
ncbi:MAG TPA: phosphohydrolase [Bacteroidales bacterium]|nr:phosphohydrolase [Bacteroidales bacterium]